ncbi:hypothetical protein GCM10022259_29480 [Aquimarina mytili]
MACSEEENLPEENFEDLNVIYASKAPYFFKASPDCSINRFQIQNLIDIASDENKLLVIEKDTYCIDNTIYIPSNIEIDFSGATIERMISALDSVYGTDTVFDMLANKDLAGNSNIVLKNLNIEGNYYKKDGSVHEDWTMHDVHRRFSGILLNNSSDVRLEKITITETVNGEQHDIKPAAGLFINNCENIVCENVNTYDNVGTGVIFNDSNYITINNSRTENNFGSGIGSSNSNYCNYTNIQSSSNGLEYYRQRDLGTQNLGGFRYTGISVNGMYSKVNNITTSRSTGSGLNIGHKNNPSDFAIVDNIHSYENLLEGITVVGSKQILLSNIHLEKNARNNLYIYNGASKVQVTNAIIHGYYNRNNIVTGGNGIKIASGGGHSIDNSLIYDNYKHGVEIFNVSGGVSIGSGTYVYNNGRNTSTGTEFAGILLNNSQNCYINGAKIFCDQPQGSKTQDYGVRVDVGGNHSLIYAEVWGNLVEDIYQVNAFNVRIIN